jgi:hypothetical protein
MECSAGAFVGQRRNFGEGRRKSDIVNRKFGESVSRSCRVCGEVVRTCASQSRENFLFPKNQKTCENMALSYLEQKESLPVPISLPQFPFEF